MHKIQQKKQNLINNIGCLLYTVVLIAVIWGISTIIVRLLGWNVKYAGFGENFFLEMFPSSVMYLQGKVGRILLFVLEPIIILCANFFSWIVLAIFFFIVVAFFGSYVVDDD